MSNDFFDTLVDVQHAYWRGIAATFEAAQPAGSQRGQAKPDLPGETAAPGSAHPWLGQLDEQLRMFSAWGQQDTLDYPAQLPDWEQSFAGIGSDQGNAAMARLTSIYQRALVAFQSQFADLASQAAADCARECAARETAGQPVTSVRVLFELWCESCDEAYLAVVRGDAYARQFGALVNAGIAVHNARYRQAERRLTLLGLPTRTEMRNLRARVETLSGELAELKKSSART